MNLIQPGRLLRYGVSGGLSALTHVGTLVALVELAGARPVWASNIGFGFSVIVSYVLQRWWVFGSTAQHRRTIPRFLIGTGAGLLLNTVVLAVGTELLMLHYSFVQVVALLLIPASNYLINSLWTFR